MAKTGAILVLHDHPEDLRARFARAAPGERFIYVNRVEDIVAVAETEQPEAVFSIKHAGFSSEAHRAVSLLTCVKWFHVGGSGVDHLLPWKRDDLIVTNSSGVLAPYLAETAMGAMLALNGHFPAYAQHQRARQWHPMPFTPLAEQTLLIVGLGAIGGKLAELAKAHGMRVIAVKRQQDAHPCVDEMHPPDALPEAVAEADYVSLHVRATPQTRHLFDAAMLKRMKPTAKLLNTARGSVVDEVALAKALVNGDIAGAYLDVFEQEPLPAESPLWDMPNVIITPHASDNIIGWPKKFGEMFLQNLERWRAGKTLLNPVDARPGG